MGITAFKYNQRPEKHKSSISAYKIGFTAGASGGIPTNINRRQSAASFFNRRRKVSRDTLSGAPVRNAKVVAISYNYTTGQITRVDSSVTDSNGIYSLIHISAGDSTDIAAYQDDELADFVHNFHGGLLG